MTEIDLDALAAARREAAGEAPTVVFHGETYTLPVELPFDVPESLALVADATLAGDSSAMTKAISTMLEGLLGEDYARFRAGRPSMQDVEAFTEAVLKVYGMAPGESPASE